MARDRSLAGDGQTTHRIVTDEGGGLGAGLAGFLPLRDASTLIASSLNSGCGSDGRDARHHQVALGQKMKWS